MSVKSDRARELAQSEMTAMYDQALTATSERAKEDGQTQLRICNIEGDTLHLSTASPIKSGGKKTNSFLTWKRAEPNA